MSAPDLLTDQRARWKRGERFLVERYLEVGLDLPTETLLDLIYQEILLREGAGERARAEEYERRFPDLWPELKLHLEIHAAFAESDGPAGAQWPVVPGYELLEVLGTGAMGVVYRARQLSLGRLVALKFLPRELTRKSDALARFQREARMASALNHPHICTIYDLGECDGQPFIAMELVAGRTLHELLGQPHSLDRVGPIVRQIAEALGVAHAAGIVHRDVKPENVMVREDGYVKVLDFGLARLLASAAEQLQTKFPSTDPGTILGTVDYMSPEQSRGEAVESPSDVFSLGVVWYQLATGRHPFARASQLSTFSAIQFRSPKPASELNPAIPSRWEALLERMLRKPPAERPSMQEVVAALEGWDRPATPVAQPARVVVGREVELAQLGSALEEASGGRARLITVPGEPGSGKTTLVERFLERVEGRRQACFVMRGRCSERLAGADPSMAIQGALGTLLRAGASAQEVMRSVAPRWYEQCAPGNPAIPTPRPMSRERRRRELVALLEALSLQAPVVLFLDDIHWADLSTVDLLAWIGTHCAGLRLLVVTTYRPSELLPTRHPFHAVKLELQARGMCREITLPALTKADVETCLATCFPRREFPDGLAARLHEHTGGSPLFVIELIRSLRRSEVLELDRELPEAVRGLVQRQLERLKEADRRLLTVASVQGPAFDAAVVARVAGGDAVNEEERLAGLERVYGLLRRVHEHELPDGTATVRFAFVHGLVRNVLYASLQPARRAKLSGAVAEALMALYRERAALEIALLFEVARDYERAIEYFAKAARVLPGDAAALTRRALSLVEKLPPSEHRDERERELFTLLSRASAS